MRFSWRLAFSLAVALVAAWALLETRGWALKAALYPRAVATPLLLLALAESLFNLRGQGDAEEGPADFAMMTSLPRNVALRRTLVIAVWIGGFFAAVLLFGFQVATPLFFVAYLRRGKEGWLLALLLPALAVAGFHLLFVGLLHLPLPAGLLWRALNQ